MAGLSVKEISKEVGRGGAWVSNVIKSPVFQSEMSRRRKGIEQSLDKQAVEQVEEAKRILQEGAADAAQLHVDIVRDKEEDARVRQISAKEILDRTFGDSKFVPQAIVMSVEQLNNLSIAISESQSFEPLKPSGKAD